MLIRNLSPQSIKINQLEQKIKLLIEKIDNKQKNDKKTKSKSLKCSIGENEIKDFLKYNEEKELKNLIDKMAEDKVKSLKPISFLSGR